MAISSNKSMFGHMFGAAGGVEAVATALTIHHGVIPPTINLHTPDPECDLDYVPNTARTADVRVGLSNSMGLGGHNACLIMRRLDELRRRTGDSPRSNGVTSATRSVALPRSAEARAAARGLLRRGR